MYVRYLLGALGICITSMLSVTLASAEQIGVYPTATVPLRPGIFVCDSEASLLQVLQRRSSAFLTQDAYTLPDDCGELLPGMKGNIEYVREYQDDVVRVDVLRYTLFQTVFPGIRLPVTTLYGYGESDFKIHFDVTLPLYFI